MRWLVIALFAMLFAGSGPRVVHFAGGQAAIAQHNGYQQVTVKDRRGNVTSVSECDGDSGSYDQIVRFGTSLKDAARRRDRKAVVSLMRFPLRVNTGPGKAYSVASAALLMERFAGVLPARSLQRLSDAEPHDVFCRDGMSMIAGGVMWAQIRGGVLRGVVVNAQP